jgi:hypothetical protein
MVSRSVTVHVPNPSTWNCQADGNPWPCGSAREKLAAAMDVRTLGIYMGVQLYDAVAVMRNCPPAELHRRFLGWLRSPFPSAV